VQAEPVLRVRDGITSGTLSLRITVRAPGLPRPFVYRNVYAAAGDTVSLSSGALSRILTILTQNTLLPVMPGSVEVVQTLDPRVRAAVIRSARIAPSTVRPGQRARLVLTLQMWRGGNRRVVVPVRIPRDLEPGRTSLRVVANAEDGFDPSFADLSSVLSGESAPVRTDPAAARAARAVALQTGATRRERLLRALRRATDDRHDAVRVLAPGEDEEDATEGTTTAVPGIVISGGRGIARIRVR
jgi:hypothetical protein